MTNQAKHILDEDKVHVGETHTSQHYLIGDKVNSKDTTEILYTEKKDFLFLHSSVNVLLHYSQVLHTQTQQTLALVQVLNFFFNFCSQTSKYAWRLRTLTF